MALQAHRINDCPDEPVLNPEAWEASLPALLVDEIDYTIESVFNDENLAVLAEECAMAFWLCRADFTGGYPLALIPFYRQCANVTGNAAVVAEAIADGSVNADMVWTLAIESRARAWPAAVVAAADRFRCAVIEAAPNWDWVQSKREAAEMKETEKQNCRCRFGIGCVCADY